jgi:hypothetical protein
LRSEEQKRDWVAHSEHVQTHLRSALIDLSAHLSAKASNEVEHLLDHNENGLALEALLFAASEESAKIDDKVGSNIDSAARLMGAPPGLWQLSGEALAARLKVSGLT